ncbi:MAG: hypothetical protein JWR38_3741 [Mucilaginibacter sp.]|nr:hypothetical protein [Mucilaginibacter sp.]
METVHGKIEHAIKRYKPLLYQTTLKDALTKHILNIGLNLHDFMLNLQLDAL